MTTQRDIEAALYREWRPIRESERLHGALPSCRTRQWMKELHRAGYATLNYRIHRGVSVPAIHSERPGAPSLIEQYWSVRTVDGIQDGSWMPSLNLHAINIVSRVATSADVEAVLRNALAIRDAAVAAGPKWFFGDDKRAELHVRALLLASKLPPDVILLAAMETLHDIPFTVAQFAFNVADGFAFEQPKELDFFWQVGGSHRTDVREFGEFLVGEDTLPAVDFRWAGTNSGPVYDAATRLTIHDGTVL